MCPCSPHLKHVGPFLSLDEFGESLNKPLQSVVLVIRLACCGVLLLPVFLHDALRPVDVVIPPVRCANWFVLIGTAGWFSCAIVLMYGVWIEVSGPICRLLSIHCCAGVLYWCAGVHAEEIVGGSGLFPSCLLAFFVCLFIFSYSSGDFYYFFFHYFQNSFGLSTSQRIHWIELKHLLLRLCITCCYRI